MFQIFLEQKDIFHDGLKKFVPYFYNHNKNLYNTFEFLKIIVFIPFKIVLEPTNIF